MEITEVRVKLTGRRGEKLQGFCSVTIDNSFVIRDLKIIKGARGLFVAMPSRKLSDRCPQCACKNHLRALYCNQCGGELGGNRAVKDVRGRAKLHADIAHPINRYCREKLQACILKEYEDELRRSREPGYVPMRLHEQPEFDDFTDGE